MQGRVEDFHIGWLALVRELWQCRDLGLHPGSMSQGLGRACQVGTVCLITLADALPSALVLAELEASNRSLQAQLHNLQQDQTEVTQLLSDFRAEQAAHNTLQAAHKALQVGGGGKERCRS